MGCRSVHIGGGEPLLDPDGLAPAGFYAEPPLSV
jgi:hypothetical protein